jgi:hypothetical protein
MPHYAAVAGDTDAINDIDDTTDAWYCDQESCCYWFKRSVKISKVMN